MFSTKTSAEELVTIKLKNYIGDPTELHVTLKGKYRTLDPAFTLKEGMTYTFSTKSGTLWIHGKEEEYRINGSLILIPERYDQEHQIYINNRPYLGAMEFSIEGQDVIRPVNQLPLEDYLKGVVPFEVYPTWSIETLKAQALAARTYAVSQMHKNMDDTIQYQVYGGYSWFENTTKAVEETQGEVITYEGKLIDAFYSASNGGYTENNAHVWGGKPISCFPIKKDPYDPVNPWEFKLNRTQIPLGEIELEDPKWWDDAIEKDKEIAQSIKKWLHSNGYPGDSKIVMIPQFEVSGEQLESKRSVKGSITIEFLYQPIGGTVLYEQVVLENEDLNRIRPMIGGTLFKSYLIDSLEEKGNQYVLRGRGYGHGVGMSQWGASVMGERGKTYQDIIEFYFPGTKIKQIEKVKSLPG